MAKTKRLYAKTSPEVFRQWNELAQHTKEGKGPLLERLIAQEYIRQGLGGNMFEREYTIVEARRENTGRAEVWYEAYTDDETWFTQEQAGILQGGGTIFRRTVTTVHAAGEREALGKFNGRK